MARKKSKAKPGEGDLVAIPLDDGSYGLAHVLERRGRIMVVVVLLTTRATKPRALADEEPGRAIACLEITGESIRDGDWPIVGSRSCKYDSEVRPAPGGVSYSDNICVWVLSRWHGIYPFKCDDALLPGVYFPGVEPPPPPPTSGPAEVIVKLDQMDERMDNTAKMIALQAQRERIIGELRDRTDACELLADRHEGFGGGMLQCHFAVQAVQLALPLIKRLVAEWEHGDITTVEVRAPS